MPHCLRLFMHRVERARSRALFRAGRSIEAKIAMIAITMRSSIRVKILIFTLRSKNLQQKTGKEEVEKHWNNRTMEQFNNGRKKEEAGSGDWQRPAQPCCRTEIPLLQHSLMRSSISVKTFVFSLRSKNLEQETRKEEGAGKHLNN